MTRRLEVTGLTKNYGHTRVLERVDFHVAGGEVMALLGTNGAGKTTTLECIEGLRVPDSGSIHINGVLGAQVQSGSLPEYLRGAEILELFSRWTKKPFPAALSRRLGVAEFQDRQYRQMSIGQKRRLHLVLALLPDPDLLLLDEPTAGLDVEGRSVIHAEIAALQKEGKGIVIATHDLSEVRQLCSRIVMLRNGAVAFDGTPQEFAEKSDDPPSICLRTPKGTELFQGDDVAAVLRNALEQCQKRNLPILDVHVERGTMEEQFLKLSKGD